MFLRLLRLLHSPPAHMQDAVDSEISDFDRLKMREGHEEEIEEVLEHMALRVWGVPIKAVVFKRAKHNRSNLLAIVRSPYGSAQIPENPVEFVQGLMRLYNRGAKDSRMKPLQYAIWSHSQSAELQVEPATEVVLAPLESRSNLGAP